MKTVHTHDNINIKGIQEFIQRIFSFVPFFGKVVSKSKMIFM